MLPRLTPEPDTTIVFLGKLGKQCVSTAIRSGLYRLVSQKKKKKLPDLRRFAILGVVVDIFKLLSILPSLTIVGVGVSRSRCRGTADRAASSKTQHA